MIDGMLARLREIVGAPGVERDPAGLPRVVPDNTESMARLFALAHGRNWRARIEGQGTWLSSDAPADFAVSTRGLERVTSVSPADLVATVDAGVAIGALRRRLADDGMWLAIDPPGRPERSIGSIVAAGTAGPLRQGFGPVRDHVLGLSVVTGDGRVVRAGGRVVKNVAGYDLGKLQIGGFGGFGVITELNLRLRALPRADQTFITRAGRDHLTSVARDLTDARLSLQALELFSPAIAAEPDWILAARIMGTEDGVAAEARRLTAATSLVWQQLPVERASSFWHLSARAVLGGAVTLRLGVLQPGLDDSLDMLAATLDEGLITAGVGSAGGIRWSGEARIDALRALRRTAASREIPMTLERAPWAIRQQLGHFGAYREGVGALVSRLRETFDPGLLLSVALEGDGDGR